ncbi:hypothetical protein [Lewinella sp. W8]|uniref:hypothetical protein n=1 Tax=Lewinella sp. W8 TaxID=2528208 RepID=UPI00106887CE|nr:hypothetical protein [Lewinella sp. W8]MTB53918.1 hypothetical protein [Lewinella sp. W8]
MRPILEYENGDKLFRRSKPHSPSQHFVESRLGELSTNWARICQNGNLVLLSPFGDSSMYSTKHTRVLVFDTSKYPEDELPERVFEDGKGNSLRVVVKHSPLAKNYSHCDIDGYLTTADGEFENALLKVSEYQGHPFTGRPLKKLRNEYRVALAYWFQFEDEEDGKERVFEVELTPPS